MNYSLNGNIKVLYETARFIAKSTLSSLEELARKAAEMYDDGYDEDDEEDWDDDEDFW